MPSAPETDILFNCWDIQEIYYKLDAQRKRSWVRARCRKCRFSVNERLSHHNARTHCPKCEEKPL